MYKKCYATRLGNNKFKIHLWDEAGYDEIEWYNWAYQECSKEECTHRGLGNEYLKKFISGIKILLTYISMILILIKNF